MLAPAFASLTPYGDASGACPGPPARLRARMAEVYGVDRGELLPVRGVSHGVELVLRRAVQRGFTSVAGSGPVLSKLAAIYGLDLESPLPLAGRGLGSGGDDNASLQAYSSPSSSPPSPNPFPARGKGGAVFLARHGDVELATPAAATALAAEVSPALLVVDESLIEFEDVASLNALVRRVPNLVVLRSLSFAYGAPGVCVGALIARADLLAELEELVEPFSLPAPSMEIAESVLSGSRVLAAEVRIARVKAERATLVDRLATSPQVDAVEGIGPFVLVRPAEPEGARAALARLGVESEALGDGRVRFGLGEVATADRILAAFGINDASRPARRAERVRDTKETRIAVAVDLDAPGKARIDTGLGFYDHMLEQLAVHGGFGLTLGCEGDLHVEAHHVIEDCALALGGAISDALGDRRGIGRYGFVLPMDDAEAKVSLDLGGRPFSTFQGAFETPLLGAFPTQMTAHVFRSLAEGMRAAIHVEVTGQDDHHKVEACFKALGRALRQAIRIEDSQLPSSKGVL